MHNEQAVSCVRQAGGQVEAQHVSHVRQDQLHWRVEHADASCVDQALKRMQHAQHVSCVCQAVIRQAMEHVSIAAVIHSRHWQERISATDAHADIK
jgi:hypothetical protein